MATYIANPLPVKISDGAGNLLTSNSTTPAGKFSLDINAVSILGTAIVTGGVAGILAVGGNVANAGAATANPVPVGGIFTTTPATLTTGSTATLQFTAAQNVKNDITTLAGTAIVTGGVAGILAVGGNVANAGAATANPVPVGGIFTTTPATLTTGSTATMQFTAAQNIKNDITTLAGTAIVTGGVAGILAVGGNVANAGAATANPVPVGGIFTTTPATLTTGSTATMQFTAAQNIKNDITTLAGTAVVTGGVAGILAVGGNVANAGAATANPVPVGGIFTTTPATLTTGSTATMQFTAAQNIKNDITTLAGTAVVTGGVAGILAVGGNVANAGAATANPVPVGGIFTTTPATLTTGQTATLQFTAAQNIKNDISTWAGATPTIATQMGLGLSQTPTVPFVGSHMIGRKSDGTGTSEPATLSTMYDVNGSGTAENVVGVSLRKLGAAGASTEYGVTGSPLFVSTRPVPDATSTYCPTAYDSAAFEFSKVVKASAGVVYAIRGYNGLASSQFIQIHNTTTLPADGAVPIVVFTAAGSANFSFTPSEHFGKFFSTGITICVSSTAATKTISLVTGVWFDVLYN